MPILPMLVVFLLRLQGLVIRAMKCVICKLPFDTGKRPDGAKTCGTFKCSQTWKARSTVKARADRRRGKGKGYIKLNGEYLHRQIAALILGRPLTKRDITHHKDGNHRNNDPLNIQVTTRKGHIFFHVKKMLAQRKKLRGY